MTLKEVKAKIKTVKAVMIWSVELNEYVQTTKRQVSSILSYKDNNYEMNAHWSETNNLLVIG